MRIIKRMKLNAADAAQVRRLAKDYIWVAIDIKKGMIAAGDEFLVDLRDALLYKYHCRASNIYGLGLDLRTGEIYYAPVINRMNSNYRKHKVIPQHICNRIETLLAYFFEDFKPFRNKTRRIYQARSLQVPTC